MNRKIYLLLKFIDYAYKRKKDYIDVNRSTSVISLCKALRKAGFIKDFVLSGFEDLELWNLRVFLNTPLLTFNDYLDNNLSYLNQSSLINLKNSNFTNFLRLNTTPYRKLVILSTPTNIKYISIFNLQKKVRIYKKILLSTHKGFIFDSEALQNNVSGILVCEFYL